MVGKLVVAAILLAVPLTVGPAQQQAQVQVAAPRAATLSTGDLIAKGTLDGASAGKNVGTGGWMAGGHVSGVLLGLIDTGISYAMAASSDVTVPTTTRELRRGAVATELHVRPPKSTEAKNLAPSPSRE